MSSVSQAQLPGCKPSSPLCVPARARPMPAVWRARRCGRCLLLSLPRPRSAVSTFPETAQATQPGNRCWLTLRDPSAILIRVGRLMVSLGQRIRRIRRAKQIRQGQLARLAGLTQSSLQKIEYGIANPSLPALLRIASALGVEPGVLLDSFSTPPGRGGGTTMNGFHHGRSLTDAERLAVLSDECRAAAQEVLRIRGDDYVDGQASRAAESLLEAAVLLRQLSRVFDTSAIAKAVQDDEQNA